MPRSKKTPDAREIGLPAGGDDEQGRSVEAHPLFPEIYDLLRHRFSPETVVRSLQCQYGEALAGMPPLPSARTIHRWRRRHMPPGDLLPPSLVEDKLAQVDVKIDLWQSLQNVYGLAEDRLAKVLNTEEMLQGVPLPATDRAFETLLRIAEQLWKVGQDLGLYPRFGIAGARFSMPLGADDRFAEDELTEEEVVVMAAALYEKRTGRPAPQLPSGHAAPAIESPNPDDRAGGNDGDGFSQ